MQKRREFIKNTLGAGSAVALGLADKNIFANTKLSIPSVTNNSQTSRVVIACDNNIRLDDFKFNPIKVSHLLDLCIESLFKVKSDIVWQSLFKPADTIGLKINCLAGRGLSTHIELVNAVIEKLLNAGLKKQNIIIWDRHDDDLIRAGYKICTSNGFVQCYGNNSSGYTGLYEYGSVASLLSKTVVKCNAIINMPILKDHGIVGISGALKNTFGVINNPNKYHDNTGDPYVADVNMLPPIRTKIILTICDAFIAQYEGGPPFMPQWTWNLNSIIAAVDMVAMDKICWEIIEEKRKEFKLPTLKQAGREPKYIATAADSDHQLGTDSKSKIDLFKVTV